MKALNAGRVSSTVLKTSNNSDKHHPWRKNMDRSLNGKVAIVTGGSRGIGRAVVRVLSELGAAVVFNYLNDKSSAEELLEHLEKSGGKGVAVQADVAQKESIATVFQKAITTYGRFDILVNNAGIAIYKRIEDFSSEEIDRIFDINIKGVFYCCQFAARQMEDNGCIINIGSTVTRAMMPNYSAYAASKAAVEQVTRVLAKELGGRGIRVNTLSPGPVDTSLFRKGKTDEQIQQLGAMAALGRIGTVEDIAAMVALLVDERSGWVTGQNILANGGFAAC